VKKKGGEGTMLAMVLKDFRMRWMREIGKDCIAAMAVN
jgi:hypothetical protein